MAVTESVGVEVGVKVAVAGAVALAVTVCVGVWVGVRVGVAVAVCVADEVGIRLAALAGIGVGSTMTGVTTTMGTGVYVPTVNAESAAWAACISAVAELAGVAVLAITGDAGVPVATTAPAGSGVAVPICCARVSSSWATTVIQAGTPGPGCSVRLLPPGTGGGDATGVGVGREAVGVAAPVGIGILVSVGTMASASVTAGAVVVALSATAAGRSRLRK